MKDLNQITAIQQAASEGLLSKVVINALHADGAMDTFTLHFKPFQASETVNLEIVQGKSYLEHVDVSLAAAVNYAADLIKRRNLTPTFMVDWSDKAKNVPGLMKDALRRFNFKTEPPPPPPAPLVSAGRASAPVYEPSPSPIRYSQTVLSYATAPPPEGMETKRVLEITPAKDPGITFTYDTTRRV